eukprot:TRINITY_DN731_c0_g1_i1.p1 TRINITY_DN731_c0_g1~~TRINITY_DN731_c0_g1_i1.p1  ORF type:complete len:166 (+),score=42.71 TRINITY_DN731_c0_g1_i1:71-568(+)
MTTESSHLINDVEKPQQQQFQQYQQATPVQGVPMYSPPQQQTVVVVNESDDFVPACLGTACFGLIGLCCFGCFCNTPTGRVGASTGCIFYGAIAFVVYLVLLILYKKDDCDDSSASAALCDTMFTQSLGSLIANVVIGAVIFIAAILFRIKYVKELQTPAVQVVA